MNGKHWKPLTIHPRLFLLVKLYTGGKNERQQLATLCLHFQVLKCSLWSVINNILASNAKKILQQTGHDSTCPHTREKNAGVIHTFRCKQKTYWPGQTSLHCLGKGRLGLPAGDRSGSQWNKLQNHGKKLLHNYREVSGKDSWGRSSNCLNGKVHNKANHTVMCRTAYLFLK